MGLSTADFPFTTSRLVDGIWYRGGELLWFSSDERGDERKKAEKKSASCRGPKPLIPARSAAAPN